MKKLPTIAPRRPVPDTISKEALLEVAREFIEYQRKKEEEETKRKEIEKEILKIEKHTQLINRTFKEIFNRAIEERDRVLNAIFETLEFAMQEKDKELLEFTISMMLAFLNTSIISPKEKEFLMKIINQDFSTEDEIPPEVEL